MGIAIPRAAEAVGRRFGGERLAVQLVAATKKFLCRTHFRDRSGVDVRLGFNVGSCNLISVIDHLLELFAQQLRGVCMSCGPDSTTGRVS